MNEADFIDQLLRPLISAKGAGDLLDDVAVLSGNGHPVIVTTDTLVEVRHFRSGDDWFTVGQKLVRVNVSDILAKAASPSECLLNLTWNPEYGEQALRLLIAGMAEDLSRYSIDLIGGDTTSHSGPVVLSLTLTGRCLRTSGPVKRQGARAGDDIWVTGHIGDAGLGLRFQHPCSELESILNARYLLPDISASGLAAMLAECATASMDLSDGLITDSAKLASASGVRLELLLEQIPFSDTARSIMTDPVYEASFFDVIDAGDDYQVLFTARPEQRGFIEQYAQAGEAKLSRIGRVDEGKGVMLLQDGEDVADTFRRGWNHTLSR